MLIVCPSCDSKVLVADGAGGQKGKCPRCGHVFVIPAAERPGAADGITAAPPPAQDRGIVLAPPSRRVEEDEDERPRRRDSWRDDDVDEDFDWHRRKRRMAQEDVGLSLASMIVGICAVVSSTCGALVCGLFSVL